MGVSRGGEMGGAPAVSLVVLLSTHGRLVFGLALVWPSMPSSSPGHGGFVSV